ncbi:helix-turn-helix transcriptional regulator [Saccharopolyspora sp. NFXS83]|uniref:helix-turn-helix domain-containing protein n=1 Tax=Saccharopolyspora sp. NFXS83 TaxID=2993560 RepID=UPI00224B5D27|nr:helix-turn-helix transcriptional regulator [Saccharopolyspora sp. NFXS83]MCX2729458.1 helix-turn-helix transcriptional regulator [Saccharopolyspora sp. NFXS83]
MTKPTGPSVRRRQLGAMLRQLRVDAGKSRKDAAEWIGVAEPTLSKIELGRQAIKQPHVRLLCQLYDLDAGTLDNLLRLARESEQRGWWAAYRDTVPDWFKQFVSLEADAVDIWEYENEFVPGQLQTAAYIAAISRAVRPHADDSEVARSVELRQERQTRLGAVSPPHLHLYISEAVVRHVVGSADAMREQLEHLVDSSKLDYVTLRVVPFGAGAYAAMAGPFIMMQFPEEPRPAFSYVENDRGGVYQEDPGDIERYTLMVRQLDELALSEDETRELIKQVSKAL